MKTQIHRHPFPCVLTLLAAAALATPVWGQYLPPPQHTEPYPATLGPADGTGPESVVAPDIAYSEAVVIDGAPWLRVHFGDSNLGQHSYVTLTSAEDGGVQQLNARSLPQWHNASAFFNGDIVLVDLHVAAGETGIFITLSGVTVGERVGAPETGGGTESLCGADNRVASGDDRAGRINGCTAWLISNGGVLTAGHCTDFDPDRSGPLLPDGVLDLSGTFSVDVPLSDPDGTPNQSAPEDQYPIDTTNVTWRFDGEGQGLGKDWSVFGLNPNSLGQRAHIVKGFFRMTRENPAAGNTMRITGFGVDNGTANRTLQTSTGPYTGEFAGNSAADRFHQYKVDTQGANSGSPVIWNTNGFTVGIHTNAGCNADGSGANSGTSFEVNALETAIRDFPGFNSEYVDSASNPAPSEDGSVFRPWNTVAEGVAGVANGRNIVIVEGSYPAAAGNTFTAGADGKAMTFLAPVGTVTIGN